MARTRADDDADEGLKVPYSASERVIARRLVQPVQRFLHTEVSGGVVLLVAAVAALVWANSPARESYVALWETRATIGIGDLAITEDLRHWVNDLLMALFFFVVGLEIKRERVHGVLADTKTALLPIICALGGMVGPAMIYAAFNAGGPGSSGWGIPMATDIAFAVGVLALVGSRAPAGLKVFLLTLAIVDDIGAILVIAVFYSAGVQAAWLGVAAASVLAIVALRRLQVRALPPYVVAAAVVWLAVFSSGVHPTIAGVILGLLTPAWPFHPPEAVTDAIGGHLSTLRKRTPDRRSDETEQSELSQVGSLANEAVSPLARMETLLHPWSAFLVLPLFALANAGVEIPAGGIGAALTGAVPLGVIAGLVLGKPIGIVGAGLLAVASRRARLPAGVGWLELTGVASLAGIGFTVSIFIAGLAFTDAALAEQAKLAILVASVVAGVLGAAALAARDAANHDTSSSDG